MYQQVEQLNRAMFYIHCNMYLLLTGISYKLAPSARLADLVISVMGFSMSRKLINH